MPKRNWNDINDSDSSLSSGAEEIQEPPKILKRVSAPPALTTNKLKNACDSTPNVGDEMSLKKIQKHEGNDVWLYIPNSFYERFQQVDAMLDAKLELKKVIRVKTIGWNVLTSKEVGRTLIQEGFTEDNLFVKFIYSNRNEEKIANGDDRPYKTQKKVTYVQKIVPNVSNQKEESNQQSSIKIKAKETLPTENAQSKIVDRPEKKKVKWIQKSKSMKQQESKIPLTFHEQLKSPQKYEDKYNKKSETYKSPKKWEVARSPKKTSELPEVQSPKRFKQKEPVKKEEQTEFKQQLSQPPPLAEAPIIESQSLTTSEIVKEDSVSQVKTIVDPVQVDSSDESIEKLQKKKRKRKPKKPKQPKNEKPDQNPFSYFTR